MRRWRLMTLSYCTTFLRESKLKPSIRFWAASSILVTLRFWIGVSSSIPIRLSKAPIWLPWKMRIRSSSQETKNWVIPGSPWRPPRPRSWLSTRRLSWRSEPITTRPPSSLTSSVSLISVPRPAILVARVIAPFWPAFSTMAASRSLFFALSSS